MRRPSFALNPKQTSGEKKSIKTKKTDKTSNKNDDDEDGEVFSRKLQFKTNPMSIGDYFAKKMNKGKSYIVEQPVVFEEEELKKDDIKVKIENFSEEVLFEVLTNTQQSSDNLKAKKDKKKKKRKASENEKEVVQSDSELG